MNAVSLLVCLSLFTKAVFAISCYECDSSQDGQCAEKLPENTYLSPIECEHLYNAQYCIKMTGLEGAVGIACYRCSSGKDFSCTELFDHDQTLLEPQSCDDVFEARYCVKATGVWEGQVGTRRFCSSRDWGNFCEYIKRPGDPLEYRACVYTCSSDGCNGAESAKSTKSAFLITVTCILSVVLRFAQGRS